MQSLKIRLDEAVKTHQCYISVLVLTPVCGGLSAKTPGYCPAVNSLVLCVDSLMIS